MNKTRFMNMLDEQCSVLKELTRGKGEEYSRSEDQLANFKRQAQELGVSPEVILFVYLNKHLDSIKNYVNSTSGRVKTGPLPTLSEPITSRIDDAVLYLILLKAMCVEKQEAQYAEKHDIPIAATGLSYPPGVR